MDSRDIYNSAPYGVLQSECRSLKEALDTAVAHNRRLQEELKREKEKAAYICDRKKCERCGDHCEHTTDIEHAINFTKYGDKWVEAPERTEVPATDTNVGDTISRQAAIDILDDFEVKIENGEEFAYSWARMRLTELPPAQPEREKGKWVYDESGKYVSCSECGLKTTRNELKGIALFGKDEPYFCPSCGADMRGKSDE